MTPHLVASNETPERGRGRPRKVKLRHLTADGRLQRWSHPPADEPQQSADEKFFSEVVLKAAN
jgi:hypothetical protein